jgi:hypothetical protein
MDLGWQNPAGLNPLPSLLPAKAELKRRHVIKESHCETCGNPVEDIYHKTYCIWQTNKGLFIHPLICLKKTKTVFFYGTEGVYFRSFSISSCFSAPFTIKENPFILFLNYIVQPKCSQHVHTHPYEYTYANPT